MTNYPSDLSMKEYQLLKPLLPELKPHPSRKWDWQIIMNAILYVSMGVMGIAIGNAQTELHRRIIKLEKQLEAIEKADS